MRRGFIKSFQGNFMSGLGFLNIEDSETGVVEPVPCENGPTVRALEACFGNTIGHGHSVNNDGGFVNREVFWDYDEFGLTLEGFTPVEELEE
jgi:hypothetical protein